MDDELQMVVRRAFGDLLLDNSESEACPSGPERTHVITGENGPEIAPLRDVSRLIKISMRRLGLGEF